MPTLTDPQTERRAEIVEAAIRAFSRKGYGGTTLADIAAEAGVSQPRISQVFGNKENAFIAAHRKAAAEVLGRLNANVDPEKAFSMDSFMAGHRDMVEERPEILLVIFQAFTSAYVPAIGEECRRLISDVVEVVRAAGGTPADARTLYERGIFVNAMLSSGTFHHAEDLSPIAEMLETLDLN